MKIIESQQTISDSSTEIAAKNLEILMVCSVDSTTSHVGEFRQSVELFNKLYSTYPDSSSSGIIIISSHLPHTPQIATCLGIQTYGYFLKRIVDRCYCVYE